MNLKSRIKSQPNTQKIMNKIKDGHQLASEGKILHLWIKIKKKIQSHDYNQLARGAQNPLIWKSNQVKS